MRRSRLIRLILTVGSVFVLASVISPYRYR